MNEIDEQIQNLRVIISNCFSSIKKDEKHKSAIELANKHNISALANFYRLKFGGLK